MLVVGVSQVPCLDEYQVCIITGRQGGKVLYLEGHGESQGDEYRADDILHDDEQAAEQLLVVHAEISFYDIYRTVFVGDDGW